MCACNVSLTWLNRWILFSYPGLTVLLLAGAVICFRVNNGFENVSERTVTTVFLPKRWCNMTVPISAPITHTQMTPLLVNAVVWLSNWMHWLRLTYDHHFFLTVRSCEYLDSVSSWQSVFFQLIACVQNRSIPMDHNHPMSGTMKIQKYCV